MLRGYNMRTLYINLTSMEIKEKPVSEEMKRKFIGGKGFDLKLLWDAVNEKTRWDSAENEINIACGPIAGNTNYPGSGKSIVTTISPQTGMPIDCNVGGHFGPYFKFSGFDALEIQGKAKTETMIYIDGNKGLIQIFEAPGESLDSHILAEQLVDMFAENERERQHVSVGLGRPRRPARLDRLPQLFLLRQAAQSHAPETGRPRRHRHGLPRQEAQSPGGQVFGPDRQSRTIPPIWRNCRRRA